MFKNYLKNLCYCLLIVITELHAGNGIVVTDLADTIIVNKTNPVFSIILQSNPTTGYSWVLKNYDANLILPIDHKFYPPAQQKLPKTGAAGHEQWNFRVKDAGLNINQVTTITFVYMRPWEKQSIKELSFKVKL